MTEVTVKPFAPAIDVAQATYTLQLQTTVLCELDDTSAAFLFNSFDQNPATPTPGGANSQRVRKRSVRVYNAGENVAFVAFGDANVVAVEPTTGVKGSMPIAPGATEVFEGISATHMAGICGSTLETDLYVTPGEGI